MSQPFTNNLGFRHVTSPGGTRNFRKELIGDSNGERFQPSKTYCRSDKTTTPRLSRRTYAAKKQVIQARLVEYHHSVAPFGTPAFVEMIYPEFRQKASLRALLRRTFCASLFLSETAGERIQFAHKIARAMDHRYR